MAPLKSERVSTLACPDCVPAAPWSVSIGGIRRTGQQGQGYEGSRPELSGSRAKNEQISAWISRASRAQRYACSFNSQAHRTSLFAGGKYGLPGEITSIYRSDAV